MKPVFLSAVGLLLSAASASAQDSLLITTPDMAGVSAPVNRNNIRYVDFGTSYNNDTRELSATGVFEKELAPTYLDSYTTSDLWKRGWFLSAAAAGSVFVGDPIGCDDLFGRARPALQVAVGKWFIPSAGMRVQYQGWDMKSGSLTSQEYHSIMTDVMLDVASLWNKDENGPFATVIPFAGCGYMLNRSVCSHSFGIHYGLIGSMRLSRHFNMNLELSAVNTFENFDGVVDKCRLGDHLLSASLGLSYTLGNKHGRQRVVDARPYMEQNSRLLGLLGNVIDENRYLVGELRDSEAMLAEYRKILEIKGWLSDISDSREARNSNKKIGYPYNNYSGLNALRDRLRNRRDGLAKSKFGNADNAQSREGGLLDDLMGNVGKWYEEVENNILSGPKQGSGVDLSDYDANSEYLDLLLSRKTFIGAPILFFFQLNSTHLTDMSQLVNLKEIAEVAKRYHLHLRIVGAADSATGTESQNLGLSNSRADYIEQELLKLGVPQESVHKSHLGGIDSYSPSVANRNTRVELYF